MTKALNQIDELINDEELANIVKVMTNLLTIQLALQQCPEFSYLKNIREANDTALLAIDAKMQLYFASRTK